MRYTLRALAVVVALLLLGVSVAPAQQHAQTRKGFWIGFGAGYGSYGVSCSGCSGLGRQGSFSGYLKMGGTLSPHLLLGGETNGWTKSENGASLTAGNASLSAYYYPNPVSGLFLSGGLGVSTVSASTGGASNSETGAGLKLGAGYDLRVGGNTSITPVFNWVWGKPQNDYKHNFFQFAVGVTFH
jgi:hypothetical protein